ncbi:MAG: GNAT family N-acetyltransferase [Myxococcales bacterium]|nr:GNAT family N-acetyltransferase [Myxococcales bacterium]
MPEIERAAAALFASSDEQVEDLEPGEAGWFDAAARKGLLFVAVDADDHPVAFALFERFPESRHLEEIDVHPDVGRQGLGRRLIEAAAAWAREAGERRITLTTFRHVAWNAPYYARLGFRELPPEVWPSAIRQRVAREADDGLDPERRVVMQLEL